MSCIRTLFGNLCAIASFGTLVSGIVLSCVNKPVITSIWIVWLLSTAVAPFFITDPEVTHQPPLKAGSVTPDIPIQTATIQQA